MPSPPDELHVWRQVTGSRWRSPKHWPSILVAYRAPRSCAQPIGGFGVVMERRRLAQDLSLDARLALSRECMSRGVSGGSVLVFVDSTIDGEERFYVYNLLKLAAERGLPVPP
jgi:hypothetical protein